MKKKLFYSVLALAGILFTPESVFASEWFVKNNATGTGNSWETATSIQNACQKAADGDIIYIAAGEYPLTQALNVSKVISLIGGFSGNETSLKNPDIQKNKAVFTGKESRAIIINNKTKAAGVILIDGLWFENFSPKEKNHGGALFINYATVDVSLKNLHFKNCAVVPTNSDDPKQGSNGGALYLNNFTEAIVLKMDNCSFDSCSAKDGGAIFINNANASAGKNINIRQCTFNKNYAAINGGGICARVGNTILMNDCLFDANTASTTDMSGNGGTVYLHQLNNLEVNTCTFKKNTATNKGSAVYGNGNEGNSNKINFRNTLIVDNQASRQNNGRYALDADNIGEHNIYTLNDCIVANNKNAKNSIADLIIINASTKNVINNSIVNGDYYTNTTAEKINAKGNNTDYLTKEQLVTLDQSRGVKDVSIYKKSK